MLKIGFFDSGIGGLSVLHHALKKLPQEQFLYYADSRHAPYGEKTEAEIAAYANAAINFLLGEGVKAIVLACNTATSAAGETMRERYPVPIIGMEPAVRKALETYGKGRILVAATSVTVQGEKLQRLIGRVDTRHVVDLLALPKLVRFAEDAFFAQEEVCNYLNEALRDYDLNAYSALVLGCTHFNYFKDSFRKVLPDQVRFVDGNEGTVNQLIRRLTEIAPQGKGPKSVAFYRSGEKVTSPDDLQRIERMMHRLDAMYEIS